MTPNAKVITEARQEMAEHVKMSPQEAKEKVAMLRQVVFDTYEKTIKNQPFFVELRAGTLPREKLKG